MMPPSLTICEPGICAREGRRGGVGSVHTREGEEGARARATRERARRERGEAKGAGAP